MAGYEESLKPIVSVIIPCYNYSHYIGEALKSLQQQTWQHWECWVIDDGSKDETATIVQEIAAGDPRIHYCYQKNQGQPVARNNGLQQVTGKYIQFLDADDLLMQDKLARQVEFLERHADSDIVYGEVRYFTDQEPLEFIINRWGNAMDHWMPKISGKGLPIISAFVKQNMLELGCALIRKSAVDRIGGFNPLLQGVEDYDFCFRAAMLQLQFDYFEANNAYCLMRHHLSSYSKGRLNMYKKELVLRRHMKQVLKDTGYDELLAINRNQYAQRLRKLQDNIINQVIKGNKSHIKVNHLKWMYAHSSFTQNLYFFPRIVKALISK